MKGEEEDKKMICGIVMPISGIDGCNESHWADVLDIISEAVESASFTPNLVSNADEVGIIHKRIIQNLYENPIVVCDVSGKNPNVMFELGMRLAFDKPTIIIKDDATSYSFDTSAIEHLEYPRDLRFSKIIDFKEKLSQKIHATYEKSTSDKDFTTFLKHFGEFTVAKIDKKEISGQEFIIEELKQLRYSMRSLERSTRYEYRNDDDSEPTTQKTTVNICLGGCSTEQLMEAVKLANSRPDVLAATIKQLDSNHAHIIIRLKPSSNLIECRQEIKHLMSPYEAKRPTRSKRTKPDDD